MRVAVTGTTGRLGAALVTRLAGGHEVIELPRAHCDLADFDSLTRTLDGLECDVLLNPAGMTSVEVCEDDARLAMRVNSAAPGKLALWAVERGVRMIHFSTDYVFGGQLPGLRQEAEPAQPLNAYGRSKLAGERAVLTHAGHLVLRVSWLFGPEKPSFIDRIMDIALAGEPLVAVADKWSIPTPTAELAGWVEQLMVGDAGGVLHACPSGEPVSWHGLAEVVVEAMVECGAFNERVPVAKQSLRDSLGMRAERPRHSAMSSERLAGVLGVELPAWRDVVADYVRARCGSVQRRS